MSDATRVIGIQAPKPGVWTVDPAHTSVEFIGRHLVFTKVRGRFTGMSGTVVVAEDPNQSTVEVSLETATVSTGIADRDGHLRSADFFDVEKYPSITFTSTSIEWTGVRGRMVGDLTVRDVTKPITLDLAFNGIVSDPWGGVRAAFSATGDVDREDWGLVWNMALEAGGVLVSKKVEIEIETELVQQ
ncbi:MAG TPA: YceI family protein [Acidimicrobiales bacterium]|nr:YceI family protein [Acidimicrobiales bacterium]